MTPLLKPAQAADILGVCEKTLQKWRACGRICWVQVTDATIRYRKQDVEELAGDRLGLVVRFEDVCPPRRKSARSKRKTIPPAMRQKVYIRDGHRCSYCGTENPPFEIDHIHPVARGGENEIENLTVACVSCNAKKRDKTIGEWLADV